MEKITKKEAIQALSEHFHIPIQTIVTFIKSRSKENKTTLTWKKKLETTEKNAIGFLGECFRVGGLGFVKIADLETNLDPAAIEEAKEFAGQMNWIDLVPNDKCIVTAIGLEKLRKVLRFSS